MKTQSFRTLLATATVALVIVLFAALIFCTWSRHDQEVGHRGARADVTVEVIESAYPSLIRKMRDVAEGQGLNPSEMEILTSPEEILEATIGDKRGPQVMGSKELNAEISSIGWRPVARAGERFIDRYSVRMKDGRRVSVASYLAGLIGTDGREWQIIIAFDEQRLQERLRQEDTP